MSADTDKANTISTHLSIQDIEFLGAGLTELKAANPEYYRINLPEILGLGIKLVTAKKLLIAKQIQEGNT